MNVITPPQYAKYLAREAKYQRTGGKANIELPYFIFAGHEKELSSLPIIGVHNCRHAIAAIRFAVTVAEHYFDLKLNDTFERLIKPYRVKKDPVVASVTDDGKIELIGDDLTPTDNMTPNDTSRENCIQFSENKHQFNYGQEANTSASRFFYCAKASPSERRMNGANNNHPTCKPLKLMEYLVKLILPPNGVVLDPFAGSGTTGIAAKNLGVDYILIELNPDYVAIAKQRLGINTPKPSTNSNSQQPSLW